MEVKHDLALKGVKVKLPEAAFEVLDEPEMVTSDHVDDLSGITLVGLDLGSFNWLNRDF